jgi:NAD(P) transhydrogenase subunit alpha
MSVTNAISGIVVVAAILQVTDTILAVQIIAFFGVLLASINVFGGFAVTSRMLKMFTRGDN